MRCDSRRQLRSSHGVEQHGTRVTGGLRVKCQASIVCDPQFDKGSENGCVQGLTPTGGDGLLNGEPGNLVPEHQDGLLIGQEVGAEEFVGDRRKCWSDSRKEPWLDPSTDERGGFEYSPGPMSEASDAGEYRIACR